jgi:selenoprotein W-related protein
LAAKILGNYKQRVQGLELQPSSGGCFELTVDDQLLYSKLQTGRFPDEQTILTEIGKRL